MHIIVKHVCCTSAGAGGGARRGKVRGDVSGSCFMACPSQIGEALLCFTVSEPGKNQPNEAHECGNPSQPARGKRETRVWSDVEIVLE